MLGGRIRKKIDREIGEEQQGFRKGRGTTDGLFTLRQFVEKKAREHVYWICRPGEGIRQCQEKW